MQQPHYIFLEDGQFLLAITHVSDDQMVLIHPFDTAKRLTLNGEFAAVLKHQLQNLSPNTTCFNLIERQYPWLKGLSTAQLVPHIQEKMVIGDELGLLFLEITDQCNEQCIHCYASSSPACSDFLSLDEIKSILKQACALGRPTIQFTGGDPLIHRDLVAAVAYADSLGVQGIEIYTNGLLLSDKLLDHLLPYKPSFAFSLYSPDAATHDEITQSKGSWKKTVSAMHRAQDRHASIRVGMAIMQQNAGHEQAMLDFVRQGFDLGKDKVRFDPVHETGRGSNLKTKHISLMPSQNSHMPDIPKQQRHHQVVQQDNIAPSPKQSSTHENMRRGKLAVSANGNISPCIFNREHVLGNIRQQSLLEAVEQAPNQGNKAPSVERWNFCQHNLSCADCQMVAYTLGEA